MSELEKMAMTFALYNLDNNKSFDLESFVDSCNLGEDFYYEILEKWNNS